MRNATWAKAIRLNNNPSTYNLKVYQGTELVGQFFNLQIYNNTPSTDISGVQTIPTDNGAGSCDVAFSDDGEMYNCATYTGYYAYHQTYGYVYLDYAPWTGDVTIIYLDEDVTSTYSDDEGHTYSNVTCGKYRMRFNIYNAYANYPLVYCQL